MIIANITSFEGQCADAEHFYCQYLEMPDKEIKKTCPIGRYGNEELKRVLNSEYEVAKLNKKDGYRSYRLGIETNRFNTIEEIHELLKEKFPTQTIVTYYEDRIFKDMLYWKDGKNLGVEVFGEVWTEVPTSVWKDLLPSEIKIKCEDCGHEYKLEEVTIEQDGYAEGRTLVKFLRKYDLDEPCCDDVYLLWNVIL